MLPARLYGLRCPSGGQVEFLLLSPLFLLKPESSTAGTGFEVDGLLRSSKALKIGDSVEFAPDFRLTVLERGPYGRVRALLCLDSAGIDPLKTLEEKFLRLGCMPLPPYIKKYVAAREVERYQTVYADSEKTGSVAAPTAGLHFTSDLLAALEERGITLARLALHVGYGTFNPVSDPDIRQHKMHAEYISISEETAGAIRKAKLEGRPVVAVGTTALRAMEGAYSNTGRIEAYDGWTDIYIKPGVRTMVADSLITNFHLPGSSLLILVCALAGRANVLRAYQEAIRCGFRFFSYGDAMLIKNFGSIIL